MKIKYNAVDVKNKVWNNFKINNMPINLIHVFNALMTKSIRKKQKRKRFKSSRPTFKNRKKC